METTKVTITFELKEGGLDTTLPEPIRAVEDLYEHIEKFGLRKESDTIDLLNGHRETTYGIKVY